MHPSTSTPSNPHYRLKALPFWLMHVAALGVFFVPFRWHYVALLVGSYYLRMFAITAGFHRYFSHRTYKMNRIPQFLMALLGTMSVQKGVLAWSATHRLHHKHSDQPDDVHSPVQHGFWYSHVGWIVGPDHDETRWDQIPDLAQYPELVWLNRHFILPVVAYAVPFYLLGGWGALLWGFVLSTVVLWHGTFTINSLSHVYGRRRYFTSDTSRNNGLLAVLTMGEGWHNNHHCYMSSANQGFFWWEWDPSYYILRALSWVGITRDLRLPPLDVLEAKRLGPGRPDNKLVQLQYVRGPYASLTKGSSDVEQHPLIGELPIH